MDLSPAHTDAVERRRRIVVNFDASFAVNVKLRREPGIGVEDVVEHLFGFADDEDTAIDSIWWNWCEGNQVPYPSQYLPLFDHPQYRQWIDDGVDIVRRVLETTKRRGLEAFFSHRMNGSDNDLGPFAVIPMKVEHPEWTFRTPWCTHEDNGYWNFALDQVHDYVLRNLGEVAENYDFDGFELDFARGVVFPSGEGWIQRHRLTQFMRRFREMLMSRSEQRGKPILVAARVPETLVGCRFDGLDVETWAREQLVDILVLGCRSFEAELVAMRSRLQGTGIKLFPSIDDHHASDGYQNPGSAVLRGVVANWWQQGADGMHTFNFNYAVSEPYADQDWPSHLLAYKEIGDPQTLAGKDKTFVVQRRGGGHGPTVVPNPEDWSTPRHSYANTNMLAQLPAALGNDGRVDTLLTIAVADDVSDGVEVEVALRLLLSDTAAADLEDGDRLDQVTVATIGHKDGLQNVPPSRDIVEAIEVRLNNSLLPAPAIDGGWLVFAVEPGQLAAGDNLVGVRASRRPAFAAAEILIEKLEIHLQYGVAR